MAFLGTVATWFVGTLSAGGAGAFFLRLGTAMFLNVLSSKLFGPKIPGSASRLEGQQVMVRSGIEYRNVVYGQAIVSGPVVYNNTGGTHRENLWYMLALCDGEIEELVSLWVDDDEITKAQIAWSAGVGGGAGSGTGIVSNSTFVDNGNNGLYAYYGYGHADQVSLAPMVSAFSEWTTNHRLRGIAYVAIKCIYNETTEKIWQRGAPSNIKAVVKGRKVYDPRLDSTQVIDDTTSPLTYGIGAHRTSDSSTWEWDDNPALCVADYLINFKGVSATKIDWPSFANAADDCDALVPVPPAASPENTQTRFTCNGVLSMGSTHKDNLDKLLSSFDGKLSYSMGKWRVRASVWEASSVSFTEDDFAGGLEIRGSSPKAERSNHIRGVFIDPSRDYSANEFPMVSNSTYLTRDNGEEIFKDLELPMTNSTQMAQRIAFRLLEQDNNQIIAKGTLNKRGSKCQVGDVVDLTIDKLSWSAKTFRVVEWERNANGTYGVTMREDSSASYDDPLVADYIDGDSSNITVPSEVVPPPTAFSASSVPYAIRLNWTNPATMEFDYIDVYASEDSSWSNASRIASVRTDTYTHNLGSGNARYYWIRARRNNGDTSVRAPDSDTSTVTSTSGAGTDSINITGATLSDEQVAATTEVGYRLTSSGLEQSYEAPSASPVTWSTISTWLLAGAASSYECRLSKTSGTDPTGGTLATWQALSSTRSWYWTDSTQNDTPVTFEGTIEIRDVSVSPANVLGSANISVTVDSQTELVTLSGTTGAPNQANDVEQESLGDAVSAWLFNSDGTVDRTNYGTTAQFATGVEWIASTPSVTYYIKATNYSGDNPTSGDSLNTWLALTSNRSWTWTKTDTSTGTVSGTLKVEISTSTSPPGIVATGYYKGTSTILPGA